MARSTDGWKEEKHDKKTVRALHTSVVDPNTLNLDPDPGFWPNLDPDPDPGL